VIEPIEAAADALADIARAGLAECVGACNHDLAQLERLRVRLAARGVRLAACQVHASLLAQGAFLRGGGRGGGGRRRAAAAPSLHEYCRAHGLALIAFAPLASGRLARRVVDGGARGGRGRSGGAPRLSPPLVAPERRGFGAGADAARLAPLLRALATAGGRGGGGGAAAPPVHAALRWLAAHDGVIAIPGCKTRAQVDLSSRARDDAYSRHRSHTRARPLAARVRTRGGGGARCGLRR